MKKKNTESFEFDYDGDERQRPNKWFSTIGRNSKGQLYLRVTTKEGDEVCLTASEFEEFESKGGRFVVFYQMKEKTKHLHTVKGVRKFITEQKPDKVRSINGDFWNIPLDLTVQDSWLEDAKAKY